MAVFPSSRPNISLRVLPKIPATLTAVGGIGISKSNGVWTISPRFTDLQLLTPSIVLDPSTKEIWIHDPVTDVYNRMTLGGLGQALWWGTSSTSLPITTGPAVFTTESGKDWLPGMYVQAVSASSPSNFMAGQVSSYVGTALTLNVGTTSGFGSHADWTLIPTGVPGTGGGGGLGTPLAVNIQTFPASGTYTPSPGMSYVIVECIGGGGGGGGTITGADVSWGGGGGSGGYSRKFASATDVGASQPVTVGTPGAAGVPAGNGGAGGDSSFGTFCVAKGGQGGAGFTPTSSLLGSLTGLGGVAGTGDVKAGGAPGDKSGMGTPVGGSTAVGGSSALGGGGAQNIPGANQGFAGLDATNYGSGGGGGIQSNAGTAVAGGAGSAGVVIVTEFIGGTGGGGGGSGTVNSGTAGQLAIYPSTGTAVSGATAAQATAALNVFTATLKGVAPLSGGGTTNFLRADGTWVAPPGGGGALTIGTSPITGGTTTRVLYDNAGVLGEYTNVQLTSLIQPFTTALSGAAPASGGGTINFLRADGTWAAPAGGGSGTVGAGTTNQLAFYPAGGTAVQGETLLQAVNMPAHTGDVTNPAGSLVNTIAAGVVTNSKLATMVTGTIKGNNSGSTGAPLDLTSTQVTAMLNPFTPTLQGVVTASAGGTTNFLRADGAWAVPAGGGSGTPLSISVQTFTASGTYTPTPGTAYAIVECVGSGGGGGACVTGGGVTWGGGGGSGGYSRKILSAATIGASQTITIGGAGTGAAAGTAANGAAGGDVSFGTLCIGRGGGGGAGYSSGIGDAFGTGGVAGVGDVTAAGETGGKSGAGTTATVPSAYGGSSTWGGGGAQTIPGAAVATDGLPASNYGSGGGGGISNAGASGPGGGAGSAGIVVVTEYSGFGGTGTVSAGTAGQLAFYSATGTAVVGATAAQGWTALGVQPAANSPAFTGDVTKPSGSLAQTIAASAVTNAKLANMVTATIKGNNSGSTGAPLDLTTTQVTAMLNTFSTSTATAGVVPGSSGAAATNFLNATGAWSVPAGGGNVSNSGTPASTQVALWTNATTVQGLANFTYNAGTLTVGAVGTQGQLALKGTTSGTVNVGVAAAAGAWTFTLPTTAGSANQFLQTNGSGVCTWATPAGGGVNAGTINQLAYYAAAGSTLSGETLLQAANMPALTGDVTNTAGALATTISAAAVTNAKLANMVTATIKGNNSGSTGAPLDLTTAQVTAMLNNFTSTLAGLAPLSGGGTTNFLRADGTWSAPGGGGAPGGSTLQVQYNNAGAFGGSNLYFESANVLGQRNGVNAQNSYVYNTFTDASNYERGALDWSTLGVLSIGQQAAGTGSPRDVAFVTSGSNTNFHFYKTIFSATQAIVGRDSGNGQVGLWLPNSGAGIFWAALPNPGTALSFSATAGIVPAAAGILQVSAGASSAPGFLQHSGQTRVTADFSVTSSVALTNVTGLVMAANVQAGRTYAFEAYLSCTCAAAGGVKAAIGGTCTATSIIYDGWILDTNVIKGQANSTALGGTVASSTTTATAGVVIQIKGSITVNAAGTLTVQFAQNTSNATASIVKRGSYFIIQDMA